MTKTNLGEKLRMLQADEQMDAELYEGETIEDATRIAAEEDCDVVMGGATTILLDYDQKVIPDKFRQSCRLLSKLFGIKSAEWWHSRSGNCHVKLEVYKELGPAERIAIQAIFGSDPVKELIALQRLIYKLRPEPSLLFRPKAAKVEVLIKEIEPDLEPWE